MIPQNKNRANSNRTAADYTPEDRIEARDRLIENMRIAREFVDRKAELHKFMDEIAATKKGSGSAIVDDPRFQVVYPVGAGPEEKVLGAWSPEDLRVEADYIERGLAADYPPRQFRRDHDAIIDAAEYREDL